MLLRRRSLTASLRTTATGSSRPLRSLTARRPGNLFEPVEGDQGAHGPFDDEAKAYSIQLWAHQAPPATPAGGRDGSLGGVLGLAAEGR